MKKRNDWLLFHEKEHLNAVKIINLLLIVLLGLLMVSCGPMEKINIELVKMDRKTLEEKLEKAGEKSKTRVNILNELAYREERNGPKKPPEKDALAYAQEAWSLAEELGYKEGIIESKCILGRIYYFRSEYEKSLEYCNDGLTRAENIGWQRGQAMAYNGIGRYRQVKGEYEKALDNFIKGKEISEKINEWRELANANYGFGALFYYDQKDYNAAIRDFEECLKMGKEIGDKTIISSGYYAIGEMYRSLRKYELAKKYFEKCLDVSQKNNIQYNRANAFEGCGEMAVDKGNLDEACKYYEKSLEIFKALGDQYQVIGTTLRLGKLYIKKENYFEALNYLKDAYNLAIEKKIPLRIKDSSVEIIKVYEKFGDYKSAVEYFNSFQKNNESLARNNMLKLNLIYEHKKKSDEEIMIRKYWIAGFLIVLAVSLLLLYTAITSVRKKQALEKSYKDIERMSEIGKKITSSLSVKDIIDKVYKNVNELMDATVFSIGIYNPEKQRLDFPGSKEYCRELPFRYCELSDENRLSVHCFNTEEEIRFGDFKKEYSKYIKEIKAPLRGDTFNSHIFLPLLLKDENIEEVKKKIGVITVQSKKINAYSDYHYNILKNLAIYVAIALDNANAYKQIEEQKTRIEQQALELAEKSKQLEKAVQIEKEISHHKDELMNTLSHQFKTPLTIIQGSAQNIRDYYHKMTEPDVQNYLKKIFSTLDYMEDMIEILLNFGKTFNPGYFDLRDFCEEFVDAIKDNEGSEHHIEFKAAGDCARVKMDKEFMEIILNNLVMNSINYSDKGSKILVDVYCDTDHAIVKVIDNGMGIPDDYLNMKFERFHRGSNVGSIRGTGLGLSLVKRYVELHNGHIEIESQLERGTTITITLPKN